MLSYPAVVPDARWLYLCLAHATHRTPNLIRLAGTGTIKDSKLMLTIEIELNGVMQNGNAVMQAFMEWVKAYRFTTPAADSFDFFVQ